MLVQQTLYPLSHSSAMTPSFMYVCLCVRVFLFYKFFLSRDILCYSRLYKLEKKPWDFLIWNFKCFKIITSIRKQQRHFRNKRTKRVSISYINFSFLYCLPSYTFIEQTQKVSGKPKICKQRMECMSQKQNYSLKLIALNVAGNKWSSLGLCDRMYKNVYETSCLKYEETRIHDLLS